MARYQIKDLGVEVNGDGLLTDRNIGYRSPLETIGDYGSSIGRAIADKKKEIAAYVALGLAAASCGGNSVMKSLENYGEPVRMVSTDPVVSEPGAKDYWLLTQGKDGCNYWVRVIDRPGPYDTVSAYGSYGEPSEEPPKRLDRAVSRFCDNIREQVSGKR